MVTERLVLGLEVLRLYPEDLTVGAGRERETEGARDGWLRTTGVGRLLTVGVEERLDEERLLDAPVPMVVRRPPRFTVEGFTERRVGTGVAVRRIGLTGL